MRRRLTVTTAAAALLTTACGDGGTDSVASDGGTPVPSASSEQVVCFGGSYEPAEEGAVVARDEVCPESSPSREPSPSLSAAAASGWDPTDALLTPEEAAQAEAETWSSTDEPGDPGPLLDPCDARTFPRAQDVVASAEDDLTWQRQESGAVVRQEVFRYRSAEAAARAFTEYEDQVERCAFLPWPNDPNDSGTRFEVVNSERAGDGARMLVRQTACNPACIVHFRSYLAVAQQADGLTVLMYGQRQDGDPQQESEAVLRVAQQVLADTVGDG